MAEVKTKDKTLEIFSSARSRGVRDALALNRAGKALWEHDMEQAGGTSLSWGQVAQEGWEDAAREIIDAWFGFRKGDPAPKA